MMLLPLYLLAAHMVGDYLLQTRWQAAGKFGWTDKAVALRTRHVAAYCVPFMPIAGVYAHGWLFPFDHDATIIVHGKACVFIAALFALHFLTDSRRFLTTPGEWLAWKLRNETAWYLIRDPSLYFEPLPVAELRRSRVSMTGESKDGPFTKHGTVREVGGTDVLIHWDLEPSPWAPTPILIDQTLHAFQLALLGALLLT